MSTLYAELGTFWPTPYGNVARVISGFIGGYGVAGGAGKAGFPVGGGYLFGSFVEGASSRVLVLVAFGTLWIVIFYTIQTY